MECAFHVARAVAIRIVCDAVAAGFVDEMPVRAVPDTKRGINVSPEAIVINVVARLASGPVGHIDVDERANFRQNCENSEIDRQEPKHRQSSLAKRTPLRISGGGGGRAAHSGWGPGDSHSINRFNRSTFTICASKEPEFPFEIAPGNCTSFPPACFPSAEPAPGGSKAGVHSDSSVR
jgi:hypothetical protein